MDSQNPFLQSVRMKIDEQAKKHGHDLEFLEGALEWLISFTRSQLSGEEREKFLMRLATYPQSKLLKLTDFDGHLSQVWKYLDDIRFQPETYSAREEQQGSYKRVTDPSGNDRRKEMAHRCTEHIKKMMSFGWSKEDQLAADECERNFVIAMKEKYPHLSWMAGRKNAAP